MSKERLRKLDEEDKKFVTELIADRPIDEISLDELLGFRIAETKCFVPHVPCGYTKAPLLSLVPMYETVVLPIYSHYWPHKAGEQRKISKDSIFKNQHGLTPNELVMLAEKGRVIPYFHHRYANYNEKIIRPLLQVGVPRITPFLMEKVRHKALVLATEKERWGDMYHLASNDVKNTNFPKSPNCMFCLVACYFSGLRTHLQEAEFPMSHVCFMSYALSIQVFDAILQTECLIAKDLLPHVGGMPEGIPIETILEGLKVNYSPNIPLNEYVDIFDGKTSRALRRIVQSLLRDPLSRKYTERLSAKIYDMNQQVEELAEGRAAKVFEAVSDMALYGGKKFIESRSDQLIKIPKKGFVKLGEWLASKGIDLSARIHRKDWSIAQLYKARCKMDKCK